MGGQTFAIREDPSQLCLDGRLWAQFCSFFFSTFQNSGKKRISRGDLGQDLLEKFSSRTWIRRGVISCFPHALFDETNDSVVNSERGELFRGSDPRLVYSADPYDR